MFDEFINSPSLFALPVTIEREQLIPLIQDAVAFSNTSSDFAATVPKLKTALHPNQAVYLILRTAPDANAPLTAVTYIPSTAPVRQKTLYASTRSTLTRELGAERFTGNVFATEEEEITNPKEWEDRERSGHGGADDAVLSNQERELQDVRRAEEQERHGTGRRDLMGTSSSRQTTSAGGPNAYATDNPDAVTTGPSTNYPNTNTATTKSASSGLRMSLDPTARTALQSMSPNPPPGSHRTGPERGRMVQLGIDTSSETLILLSSAPCLDPDEVTHSIPPDKPSYTFYHYPTTNAVVFIYACPASSKVKERMLYASSRSSVLDAARGEGVEIGKRLEIGEPGEIGAQRFREELEDAGNGGTGGGEEGGVGRGGFARPKRPGKR